MILYIFNINCLYKHIHICICLSEEVGRGGKKGERKGGKERSGENNGKKYPQIISNKCLSHEIVIFFFCYSFSLFSNFLYNQKFQGISYK